MSPEPIITVSGLDLAYGEFIILKDINFTVKRGDIFIIMGASGSGKSTLLRSMVGLLEPVKGTVSFEATNFWGAEEDDRLRLMRKFGVLYQGGALWSSMTLAENIALPLQEYTDLSPDRIAEIVSFKLSLVGLAGFEEHYPSEISGGMRKRAGIARAIALDPGILFFDEPSAGLDPVSARLLDDLILDLRDSLGATVIIVTHELASIFAVGNNSIFIDADTRTVIAEGDPKELLANSKDHRIWNFLTRGKGLPTVS